LFGWCRALMCHTTTHLFSNSIVAFNAIIACIACKWKKYSNMTQLLLFSSLSNILKVQVLTSWKNRLNPDQKTVRIIRVYEPIFFLKWFLFKVWICLWAIFLKFSSLKD
jgi:hypothetical protein